MAVCIRWSRAGVIAALAAAASAGGAQAPDPVALDAKAGSALTIRGSTTIGKSWHCGAKDVRATVVMSDSAVSADAREVLWVRVVVPVAALKCQSGPMDRAMRKAMRAERDTSQVIDGNFATDPGRPESERAAHLVGTLTVSGETQQVAFSSEVERLADGRLRVRSTIPLTLSGFLIAAPRVLFGAVRARDAIAVEVDLVF